MKVLLLSLCLGYAGSAAAQVATFDFAKLRYAKVPFSNTKAQLVRQLGPPTRITEPTYECGGLSAGEQNKKFYSLHYGPAVFTGNATDNYVLETVKFKPGVQPLQYGRVAWNAATTRQEIERQFRAKPDPTEKPQPDGSTLLLIRSKYDDGAMFIFKKGHLVEFQYWTPC